MNERRLIVIAGVNHPRNMMWNYSFGSPLPTHRTTVQSEGRRRWDASTGDDPKEQECWSVIYALGAASVIVQGRWSQVSCRDRVCMCGLHPHAGLQCRGMSPLRWIHCTLHPSENDIRGFYENWKIEKRYMYSCTNTTSHHFFERWNSCFGKKSRDKFHR